MIIFTGIEDNNTEFYMKTHTHTNPKILNSHSHPTKKDGVGSIGISYF